MDPQTQLSGLDPKLKEAYERVMGTTIPPASPPPAPPQEPATSAPTSQTEPSSPPPLPSNEPPKEPASPPIQEPTPQPPPPVAPPQPPEPPPIPPVQPPVAQNEPTGFVANAAKKGKLGGLKISPPILMAVGVGLLVLYIFFWIRVFNLSLF